MRFEALEGKIDARFDEFEKQFKAMMDFMKKEGKRASITEPSHSDQNHLDPHVRRSELEHCGSPRVVDLTGENHLVGNRESLVKRVEMRLFQGLNVYG